MRNKLIYALALAALCGCVQTRPSRNGVFNENQYARKDFLIRNGDGTSVDNGWFSQATIVAVSTPNLLGGFGIDVEPGITAGAQLVRFEVTEDHLNMLNMREITNQDDPYRIPEVVNSWPITNVDLKYRINLDGETTNFYEENQENDWQIRQWVKVKFAKNDMSDVAPFGSFLNDHLEQCADIGNAAVTLVPDSFRTEQNDADPSKDYMEWVVSITLPLKFTDEACLQSYGPFMMNALRLGKENVTFQMKYSFTRATPLDQVTYKPLEVAEKDSIRHKYAFLEYTTEDRDPNTQLVAARELVMRHDPNKDYVWYFGRGFPENMKDIWLGPGGIKDQTNSLLAATGATMKVDFKNFDDDLADGQRPRELGDMRYNFLIWQPDLDTDEFWGGTTPSPDPRTGEILDTMIVFSEETFIPTRDWFVERINSYLQTVGAADDINQAGPWADLGKCTDGQTQKLVQDTIINNHNGKSSLYNKIQQYLQKPASTFGPLGPADFVPPADADFDQAYYQLLPYYIYADPASNQFVTPEGGAGTYGPNSFHADLQREYDFQHLAASVDKGETPYEDATGTQGVLNAANFLNTFRQNTLDHRTYEYNARMLQRQKHIFRDDMSSFSFEQVIAHAARHCVNGQWETKEQWADNLVKTFWTQVFWHEFGHAMGLDHNFMGSLDKNNFPRWHTTKVCAADADCGNNGFCSNVDPMTKKGTCDQTAMFSNSVMEYGATPADVIFHPGWGPYDAAAISWIYANNSRSADKTCAADADCGNGICAAIDPDTMKGTCQPNSITGQLSSTSPWNDKAGWSADGKTETSYLMCRDWQSNNTPFCQPYDIGTRPSEIIANQIDEYEWQYNWSNYRTYRKFWDESAYANRPAQMVSDLKKFLPVWMYDWSASEIADTLRRIGVQPPADAPSAQAYFQQLTDKFNKEASAANQLMAAWHKAIIQESAGERPYRSIYDPFYGDVTQQGIILDKLFAMQSFAGLWEITDFDVNQAQGNYIASYAAVGDDSYNYVAQDALVSMIGGQYDVYPYFVPLAVVQFAQDTHSPSFGPRVEVRDWIGGHTFYRLQDFLDFFCDLAVQNNYPQGNCDQNGNCQPATTLQQCSYDPRSQSDQHNEFVGPDSRIWIWAYIADRNEWVAVQKERNIASYVIVRNYTDDVIYNLDDGAYPGGAYTAQLPMKYFLDSFDTYN